MPSSARRVTPPDRRGVWEVTGAREARRGVTTQSTERTRVSAGAKEPCALLSSHERSAEWVRRGQVLSRKSADCFCRRRLRRKLRRARRSPRWERLALSGPREIRLSSRTADSSSLHLSSSLQPPFPVCRPRGAGAMAHPPREAARQTMPKEQTRNKGAVEKRPAACGETGSARILSGYASWQGRRIKEEQPA